MTDFEKIDVPDTFDGTGYRRGYSERELIALDLAYTGLVCLSPVCMASGDCPHMATKECDPKSCIQSS
jgi:hypothetical protein